MCSRAKVVTGVGIAIIGIGAIGLMVGWSSVPDDPYSFSPSTGISNLSRGATVVPSSEYIVAWSTFLFAGVVAVIIGVCAPVSARARTRRRRARRWERRRMLLLCMLKEQPAECRLGQLPPEIQLQILRYTD